MKRLSITKKTPSYLHTRKIEDILSPFLVTGANRLHVQPPHDIEMRDTELGLTKADEVLKSNSTTGAGLRTFTLFPKLPREIRFEIWKLAGENLPGRVVCIQPHFNNNPAHLETNQEARREGSQYFKYYKSNQQYLSFELFINHDKDIIYLNHKFRVGNERQKSVLHAAFKVYPSWLTSMKNIAMNMPELKKLTSPSSREPIALWTMLNHACPNLKYLLAVLNGPVSHNRQSKLERLSEKHRNKGLFPDQSLAKRRLDEFEMVLNNLKEVQDNLGLCKNVMLLEVVEEMII